MESKPRILIISSADPTVGPGVLTSDLYMAYSKHGLEVDVLTLYKCPKFPDFMYVYDKKPTAIKKFWIGLTHHPLELFTTFIEKKILGVNFSTSTHPFFYKKEENPPIPVSSVLNKINKEYDKVIIHFWQGMLSFATVLAIYRKLRCEIVFGCMDFSPMTGGCHFVGDCEGYKTGCGCCPAIKSKNPHDFTWQNVKYRMKVYEEVNPIVTGNSYMFSYYDQSILLKNCRRVKSYPIIDLSLFKPYPRADIQKQLGVANNKTFVMMFGCQSVTDERKGFEYLIKAINLFLGSLNKEDIEKVLILSIGKDFEKIKSFLPNVDTLDLGYVSKEELPALYSFSDVFLCSSVNDAGPMMVNQALCCGTPVVGFEMGACLDAVKDRGTGYCAELRNYIDFANGIATIYSLSDSDRKIMSERCVSLANELYSYEAAIKRVSY